MKKRLFALILALLLCTMLLPAGCGAEACEPMEMLRMGEGEKTFTLLVKDAQGNETRYEISSDAETVGEALTQLGLIEGEQSAYGLYVKTVAGITADYAVDGKYWAFYINGEYAMTGVDQTALEIGAFYTLQVE